MSKRIPEETFGVLIGWVQPLLGCLGWDVRRTRSQLDVLWDAFQWGFALARFH